jgi:hypothetical protein
MAYENKSVNTIELQEGGRLLLFEVGNIGFTVCVERFAQMVRGDTSIQTIMNNIATCLYLDGFNPDDCGDAEKLKAALKNKNFRF